MNASSFYLILTNLVRDPSMLSILILPLFLIPLDVITGIIRSVRQKKFSFRRATDFMGNDLLKYIGMFVFVVFTWIGTGEMSATAIASTLGMSALSLSIGASIIANLAAIGAPPTLQNGVKQIVEKIEAQSPSPVSTQAAYEQYALNTAQIFANEITSPLPAMPAVEKKKQFVLPLGMSTFAPREFIL